MNLVELGAVTTASLPIAGFRAHMRLGTGFGEETLQDAVLEGFLRASLAAIEARISKILLRRDFRLELTFWQNATAHALPIAPIDAVSSLIRRNPDGSEETVPAGQYRLETDKHRPKLRPSGACLPLIPEGGQIRVLFSAGFANWAALPADLQQAVFLLAAHYYEYRNETSLARGCMPFGVTSLIEAYREKRIGLEGA